MAPALCEAADTTCRLAAGGAILLFAWNVVIAAVFAVRVYRWRASRYGITMLTLEKDEVFEDATEPLLGSLNGASHGPAPGHGANGGHELHLQKNVILHWTKFIVYGTQVMYHVCVATYDGVDGSGDEPYKYLSNILLAAAWSLLCVVETLQHELPWTRRTSVPQLCFPVLCFALATAQLVESGRAKPTQLAAWDLGLLLLAALLDLYGATHDVTVRRFETLTPEYAAGFWSFWHLSWFTEVVDRGYKKPLEMTDLPQLVDGDQAANAWEKFSRLLYPRGPGAVKVGEDLHVGRSVVKLGGCRYPMQAFAAFVGAITQLIPPLALMKVTEYMSSEGEGGGVPLIVVVCVIGLFAAQSLANYADGQMFKLGRRMGIRARSALVAAVFRKALALDMSSADAGELQNFISVDAESVLNLMVFQMFMWSAVLRLVACVVLLFWVLGLSAFGGLGLIVLTLPVNKWLVGRLKQLQLELMKRRDARMSVVSECMLGIRIIKFFAWEKRFLAKVMDVRALEMVLLRSYMFTLGTFMVAIRSSPTLIGLVTFLLHTKVFKYELTAAAGFTALTLFSQLRMPLSALPDTFNYYIQARVSFRRIQKFLSRASDDVRQQRGDAGDGSGRESGKHCTSLAKGQLKMEKATFRWRAATEQGPTLVDLNMDLEPGQLVCVYGPTGAGKSSLLLAFLQELLCLKGRSMMNGSVAYSSQRAWIQNATLRDNILFGSPFDPIRYDAVLEACALKPDLELLEAGDATEIGEKGVNLSGGQQQRVSLARAAYANTDIVLMDDVLSAVDAHVGKHIFDKCVRGLLRGRTRVLVTHQVMTTARYADHIIVFNADGSIREQGSYKELTKAGGDGHLAEVIELAAGPGMLLRRGSSSSFYCGSGAEEGGGSPKDRAASSSSEPATQATLAQGAMAAVPTTAVGKQLAGESAPNGNGNYGGTKSGRLVQDEARAVGRPKFGLFLAYFRACGGWWFGGAWAVLSVAWQALTIAQSFFLRRWINDMSGASEGASAGLWLYIGASLASFVALLVRTLLITSGSLTASRRMHDAMAASVFGALVSWFDATPLGRIFNRFSSDVLTLDKDLMNDLSGYTDVLLSVFGVVVVIVAAIPILTVFMVPVLALCYYYSDRYLQTSRQMKRLEAVQRSPLYAHFSESVGGVSIIRAFEAESRFMQTSEMRADELNRAHLCLWIANYWLTNRVRNIGSAVCGLVGAFLMSRAGAIDGGTAGLVLTYSLQFTVAVVFTVRSHATMEMSVNSVERLVEFTKLPQEAAAIVPNNRPPASWPADGEVKIEHLTLKYASVDTPVLRDVSFHVPRRTRVGIVGRTGAGKSSLMNALFRIVKPMAGSVIEIDGINILKIGLNDLRRKLAIIPQEPTLFQGTIRNNVDCFDEHPDSAIWAVLEQCHLRAFVAATDRKLEHVVAAGGSNLSMGQRQLLCMARALLRRATVLVMDEATANVDLETDKAIQDTMRDGFSDCTVLCIAHRLHTVVYYDRVLVLEMGRVAEYDTPQNLLKDPDGLFRALCERTGDLASLEAAAAAAAAAGSGTGAAAAAAAADAAAAAAVRTQKEVIGSGDAGKNLK